MKRRSVLIPSVLAGLAAAAATAPLAAAAWTNAPATSSSCATTFAGGGLDAYGLSAGQRLMCFDAQRPGMAATIGTLKGFSGPDTRLVGMDHRPATGALYGLGDGGGVYTINPHTARITLVSRLNAALDGARVDVDFNPTVDRLRIISAAGQNLRTNVDDGMTTVDPVLNYLGPPVVSPATGVSAAAYTNNDVDPDTATTLFDIDSALDQVVVQAPANSGTLNPTGKLGVNASGGVGFDIATADNDAFAVFSSNRRANLYSIELLTGEASMVGSFPTTVIDIAIPLGQG